MTHTEESALTVEEIDHVLQLHRDGLPLMPGDIERLAAAARLQVCGQAASEGWQPIETAPIETVVLTLWDGIDRPSGKPSRYHEAAWLDPEDGQWKGEHYADIVDTPTHWMPLPKPPTLRDKPLSKEDAEDIAFAEAAMAEGEFVTLEELKTTLRDEPIAGEVFGRRFGSRHDKPCKDPNVTTCTLYECQTANECQRDEPIAGELTPEEIIAKPRRAPSPSGVSEQELVKRLHELSNGPGELQQACWDAMECIDDLRTQLDDTNDRYGNCLIEIADLTTQLSTATEKLERIARNDGNRGCTWDADIARAALASLAPASKEGI